MTAQPTTTRRERARAATVEEIKATALTLMRESATTDIRFTDIARVMGMTPPALYRYYADRDALLTDLITDAFGALGDVLSAATASAADGDPWARWLAAATAYRTWARDEPQRFALILGMPVPGYAAPDEGPTTEAAKRAMDQLAALFVAAAQSGQLRPPLVREVSPGMVSCATEAHPELDGIVPPESFQAMIHAWASLHGFTSLEAYGHLDWMDPATRDALFAGHMRLVAHAAGLPVPA